MTSIVYKILPDADWRRAVAAGHYTGSADDLRDGFIHFSTGPQLAGTARKYFRGQSGLVLVAIDAARLGAALKFEASRGGDLFPHLYAPLPTSAALWEKPLPLAADGVPALPEDLP